jgi:hypothetical protein
MFPFRPVWCFRASVLAIALAVLPGPVAAEEPVKLREAFPAGYQYRVSTRVDLTGKLTLPADKGKTPGPLSVVGSSAIDYDERVLAADGEAGKTVRVYRRVEFDRKVGEQAQKASLRAEVRRLVLLRHKNSEVPFSPEGPLTYGEIDLVRTDVFTPALTGLLPERAVRPGDRWAATADAVQELTDLDRIEEGQVECRLEGIATLEKRRHARVTLSGTVRGANEDGPSRQQLEGYYYFDLESSHLSYLSLRGVHAMLGKDGKEAGRVEGQFVLTRQAHTTARELADDALKGLALEPNADNTLLLYESAELGVKLLYPRRWRVAGGVGRQVRLDGSGGAGLLIHLEPPARVPTAAQFLDESRAYFRSQKAKVVAEDAPRRVRAAPRELDQFGLEVEMGGQRVLMDYHVLRQAEGGATLAARLPQTDQAALRREVSAIARSLTVTRALK